jgi:retron-type reverse transcriptase
MDLIGMFKRFFRWLLGLGEQQKEPLQLPKHPNDWPPAQHAPPPAGVLWKLVQPPKRRVKGIKDLAQWLSVSKKTLNAFQPSYTSFQVPKRSGGVREIRSPSSALKQLQRRILRRVLRRHRAHRAATGFERAQSIVTNASRHCGQAVVVTIDLKDFFPNTTTQRVYEYFTKKAGWTPGAAQVLTKLCTSEGGLPQGAPTSPRLSNLVNIRMDARLEGLATKLGARYSRYADDLTFSFAADDREVINKLISGVEHIVGLYGYQIHRKAKLEIRRGHQRQMVTGLVVNQRVNVPRRTRRWLRAVEHRLRQGLPADLDEGQLAGWKALLHMVELQRPETGSEV